MEMPAQVDIGQIICIDSAYTLHWEMDLVYLVLFVLFMPALYFLVLNLGSGSLEDCPNCGVENPNDAEHCKKCRQYRPLDILSENYWLLAIGGLCCILAMIGWIASPG